ncbi:MAG: hypothetical protein A2V65_07700 [Deltaproteobacteria bacterium RBG_13_49_15]|nr:MAG: hypothetical protein A2V65_07700 [Deltaproteobacteria bacterium RBG_13_49_15]
MTEETRQVLVMPDPGSGPGQARSGIQSSMMHDCPDKSLNLGITKIQRLKKHKIQKIKIPNANNQIQKQRW